VFRRTLENSDISGLFVRHPTAGRCILINYDEDIYRQRFTAGHEAAHAILDHDQDVVISFQKWAGDQLSEIRANTFASRFLLPPDALRDLPAPQRWMASDAVQWANKFKVSTAALANALKDEKLIDKPVEEAIKAVKVPAQMKTDPELSPSLSPGPRARKAELLRLGLSGFYVDLCFDAYEEGHVTAGRIAEMLLVTPHELNDLATLYGRTLRHAS
jgi:Zn-dependent peptidase ImmA (M78 family)